MRGIIFSLILFFITPPSFGQGALEREHPRVSELQDKLTEYARHYLQTRLQGIPFMVTVRIEALRRRAGSNYKPQNERLPYFDSVSEEIRDEWDDPSASLYVLQSRIQKATLAISLPKALRDEEIQEIKDSLMTLLRLIPGRDEIKIEQRSWSLGTTFWNYVILASTALLVLLVGLGLISRQWSKRLTHAIHDIKPKEKADPEAASGAGQVHVSQAINPLGPRSATQDLKFRDPLKTREFVSGRVNELASNPNFPNLQAMIEMDKLAERAPRDLGALLMEFPFAKQKELFAYSYNPSWLIAFTEPGELSAESIELVDRLCRMHYDEHSSELERLIIHVWREGANRPNFLRSIDRDLSFSILKSMPSSIAVPAARQAFPGAWAVLLDSNFKPKAISSAKIRELVSQLMAGNPLNEFSSLDKFRQEKDLLSYLLICTVPEEKDIYGALTPDSKLWTVRPPFFRVVEADVEEIKNIIDRISIDEWALALFNVSRDHRRPFEALLNPKQKFLFLSKMRAIDQSGLDRAIMGEVRLKIARMYYDLKASEDISNKSAADETNAAEAKDAEDRSHAA